MKLVSDFDGVWTDPQDEACAQGEALEETLLSWSQSRRAEWGAWLAQARAAVARQPRHYGWAPGGGRLSAYGDEDPFAPHSALLHYLHERTGGDPVARALVEAIAANGYADLDAFGAQMHARGVELVAQSRGPGILPAAAEAGRALLAGGVEVVVVSNSGPAKLERWFTHAGVPARVHPERAPGALRLRGGARKFMLDGAGADVLRLGELEIEVGRPHYETVLREERPDAVVGDVFSLDLALPLALRRREPAWSGTRLFWLVHPYTPRWLRAEVERHAGGEIEVVEGGLAALATRLLEAGR